MMNQLLVLGFFPALMSFAAASDLVTMTISNRVSLALVAGFGLMAVIGGLGLPIIGLHVLACALVLAITFGMFACGWMGGGDAKLAAATALWIGWSPLLLNYALITSVYGGVLALALLRLRRYPIPAFAQGWSWLTHLHSTGTGVPYGIALALGGLTVYPETTIWNAVLGL
jgi:prepilin peptidase CpaA